jgi:hypothetical protein
VTARKPLAATLLSSHVCALTGSYQRSRPVAPPPKTEASTPPVTHGRAEIPGASNIRGMRRASASRNGGRRQDQLSATRLWAAVEAAAYNPA